MSAAIYDYVAIRKRMNEIQNPMSEYAQLVQILEASVKTFTRDMAKANAVADAAFDQLEKRHAMRMR